MTWVTQEAIEYLPVVILIGIALVISSAILILNKVLGQTPQEVTKIKGDMYECGVPYVGDARQQFSVRYYLVGIVFLVFDVEVVFMYPWAVVYKTYLAHGAFILWEMAIFFALVLAGYVYLRLRGGLNWD